MATSTVACKSSIFWCSECEEFVFNDCKHCHSLDKATRDHATITIEEYQKSPSSIIGIKQLCDKHPEKYQTYCKEHQNLYCRKCAITSHNNCKDKFPLEEVVDREKNPSFVQKMEQFLDVLTKNIKTIIASEKDNLDMLNETKEEIEKKIKQTRLAINRYLDKLEKQLLTKLQKESDREKRKIMKSEATLAKKGKKIRECQDILQNIQTNATDLQAFVCWKQIKADIRKNKLFVQSLIEDKQVLKRKLQCTIHQTLETLTTDVDCFGSVTTSRRPCDITLVR